MTFSRGIALVQVLLISAIISILAIYISQTARQQVNWAINHTDYADGIFSIQSAEAELIYTLLTNQRTLSDTNNITRNWNFHNQQFDFDANTRISIQDLAAKISIAFGPNQEFISLLESYGLSSGQSMLISDSLFDWVDSDNLTRLNGAEQSYYKNFGLIEPRNAPLQTLRELKLIRGVNDEIYQNIFSDLTLHTTSYFNPFLASKSVLNSLVDLDVTSTILKLRAAGELDHSRFTRLTGISEVEGLNFYPSKKLNLTINYKKNHIHMNKSLTIEVSYSQTNPFQIIEISWN
jgi:general secretion pathway protein K